jgi:hypothetical protein
MLFEMLTNFPAVHRLFQESLPMTGARVGMGKQHQGQYGQAPKP